MKNPAFPPVDCILGYLSEVNYRKVAHEALMLIATICAIIVATSLFTYRKSRAFWQAHGDDIILRSKQLIAQTVKALVITYQAAVIIFKAIISMQKATANWANLAADWVFYRVAMA